MTALSPVPSVLPHAPRCVKARTARRAARTAVGRLVPPGVLRAPRWEGSYRPACCAHRVGKARTARRAARTAVGRLVPPGVLRAPRWEGLYRPACCAHRGGKAGTARRAARTAVGRLVPPGVLQPPACVALYRPACCAAPCAAQEDHSDGLRRVRLVHPAGGRGGEGGPSARVGAGGIGRTGTGNVTAAGERGTSACDLLACPDNRLS